MDDHNPSVLRSRESAGLIVPLAEVAGVEVLVVNCTAPEAMREALVNLQEAARKRDYANVRWGCYANAFPVVTSDFLQHPDYVTGHRCDPSSAKREVSPRRFAEYGLQWVRECFVTVFRGCYATTLPHIRAMTHALRAQDEGEETYLSRS